MIYIFLLLPWSSNILFFYFSPKKILYKKKLKIQVKLNLKRYANRDKEYETASGRAPSGILSAISRKSTTTQMSSVSRKNTQVAPSAPPATTIMTSTQQQHGQPHQDEASRITPVEQSTSATSPTPTVKERPRSNFSSFPPLLTLLTITNVYQLFFFFGGTTFFWFKRYWCVCFCV